MNNKNKTILITGAHSGLGSVIAKKLMESGHRVIATSRTYEWMQYDVFPQDRLIKQYLDVTIEHSVKKIFAWLNSLNVDLDVLINNAGVGIFKPLIEITSEEWNSIIQTNLTGVFLCAKEAYKACGLQTAAASLILDP